MFLIDWINATPQTTIIFITDFASGKGTSTKFATISIIGGYNSTIITNISPDAA